MEVNVLLVVAIVALSARFAQLRMEGVQPLTDVIA
jgi:hypothetical protein